MITVTYNRENTQIKEGQSATFQCLGKRMKSDVVISGDTPATIRYGSITNVTLKEGSTATFFCEDKVMKADLFVNATASIIVVYSTDKVTPIQECVVGTPVTVTFHRNYPFKSSLEFSYNGTEVKYTLDADYAGISDDVDYPCVEYADGESFTLEGCKTHALYMQWTPFHVTFYGLGEEKGVICALGSDMEKWSIWVSRDRENLIGAQIIDGYVRTSDGTKILCDSEGARVSADDFAVNGGEYTFVDV